METSDTSFEVEAYIFVGNKARDAGKYDEANGYYRQALAINPREWRAHYGLGNVFFDQAFLARATNQPIDVSKSSMANAIEEYKRAAELSNTGEQRESTEVAELYSDLAQAYYQNGNLSKAQELVNKAIGLNPRSPSAIRRQGSIISAQSNYDEYGLAEAVSKYKQSLALDPNNALTHRALGSAYYRQKNFEQAISEFKEVVRLRPDYDIGYQDIGQFYFERGKYREAIEPYSKALALNPRLVYVRFNLSISYCKLGDKAAAQREYETLKGINPGMAGELYNLIQDCRVGRPSSSYD